MLSARREESGFTLVELVLTVAIMGVVVTALVGVVFQFLRVSNESSTRLSESTDQQIVSAYWQQDVSSLGVHDFTGGTTPPKASAWVPPAAAPSGVPAGCSSLPAGASAVVVGMVWNEYPSGNTDPFTTWTSPAVNAALYYTKDVGTQLELWRTRCTPGGSRTTRIARHLDKVTPPTATCLDAAGATTSCGSAPYPALVRLKLVVRDTTEAVHASTGYTTTLTAQTRQG